DLDQAIAATAAGAADAGSAEDGARDAAGSAVDGSAEDSRREAPAVPSPTVASVRFASSELFRQRRCVKLCGEASSGRGHCLWGKPDACSEVFVLSARARLP